MSHIRRSFTNSHHPRLSTCCRRIAALAALVLTTALAACTSTPSVRPPHDVAPDPVVAHVAELLRNHPSVRLHGTGSGMRISIRGALGEPLIVLDGLALAPESGGILATIDPREVASIRVLTDPADLTFYGLRGANGVVVVRTKRR